MTFGQGETVAEHLQHLFVDLEVYILGRISTFLFSFLHFFKCSVPFVFAHLSIIPVSRTNLVNIRLVLLHGVHAFGPGGFLKIGTFNSHPVMMIVQQFTESFTELHFFAV